jgi:hypothetical protein
MSDWVGESMWIGGVSNYSRGEFIYQDHIYDDYGAATGVDAGDGPEQVKIVETFDMPYNALCPPKGSFRYPKDTARYGNNCADLLQLRMAADKTGIYFLIWLNTLLVPDSTVVGIAFDTDIGESEPAKCRGYRWPFEAGIVTPGTDHVLTLWGTGGAWDEQDLDSVGGQVAVSVEENVIEASIPRELLGTLRFWCYAATGLWDPQTKTWLEVRQKRDEKYPGGGRPGCPRVFNLAFRSEESGMWFEDRQAMLLRASEVATQTGSMSGAIHLAAQFIDLDNPADSLPELPAGYYQRIYRSSVHLGEGVAERGIPARGRTGARLHYHFLGQHQPYAVYVPKEYDGVLLWLHGALANHTGTVSEAPFQRDIGDAGRNIVVSALGRGPVGGWVDYSYLDALEALEDAVDRYHIDRDRVYIGGWSMGGQGTNRQLTTRPDVFAASFQVAPGEIRMADDPQKDIAINPGSTIDLYENMRHIPVLFVLATARRDGNTVLTQPKVEKLKEMGYMYHSYTHPLYGHVDFARAGDWTREQDWLKNRRLVHNPAHVTYKFCEAWWRPDISPRLVFDHAYWVSGLRVRDTSQGLHSFGKVDVVSHALGGSEPELRTFHYSLPGPPSCYEVEGQDYKWPGQENEQYNGFRATFENLKTVSFDTEAMGLELSLPVRFDITSDGLTQMCLTGTWPKLRVSMDGKVIQQWRRIDSGLELEVLKGSHSFEIEPIR